MTNANSRQSEYPIDPLFLERWSPRAFTGELMPSQDLLTILDAAHWAPSASNLQPWRFVYALNGDKHWADLLGLLVEANQRWAKNASALIIVISKTHTTSRTGESTPSYTHAFDSGTAWGTLALQAHLMGYHSHGMGGIDRQKAFDTLNVPEGYRVEIAVAVGKLAARETLPDDLRERETPNSRVALADVAFEGSFTGKRD
jgi:nitroreductase